MKRILLIVLLGVLYSAGQDDAFLRWNNGTNRLLFDGGGFTASTYCWHLQNTGQPIHVYDLSDALQPQYDEPAGQGSAHIMDGWEIQSEASSVIVAIVDDDFDLFHPDLLGRFIPGHSFNGTAKAAQKMDWRGDGLLGDHGTMTAGTIGAIGNNGIGIAGVCRDGVQLLPLWINSTEGVGDAIEFASTNGASIINLPWGIGYPDNRLFEAISNAERQGVLIVCAAANWRQNYDDPNSFYEDYPPQWATTFSNLLVVSGMTMAEVPFGFAYSSNFVHLLAPCRRLPSTAPDGYAYWSGNSAACAIVSGAAGLLKQRWPGEWPKATLLTSVDVRAAYQGECTTGGSLNVYRALREHRPMRPVARFTSTPP